jgi:NAD(P)-dependent dehydrogenase (short-subunit alcohol dehydrogenase family)
MASPARGRIIVLTGATRGLGRALLDRFVRQGHGSFGCGRSADKVQQLRQHFGTPHDFAVLDVRHANEVTAWADQVLSQAGPPDLLVNNAAIINRPAPLWKVSQEDFDALIDVNVKGMANVIRAFVPAMVERRGGVIVNFSSGWGRSTSPEVAPYCASKYAVEGMTLALAQELPQGMAAVSLNPGVIDTDMLRECFGSVASSYPSPSEWAEKAAKYILSISPKDNGHPLTVPGVALG